MLCQKPVWERLRRNGVEGMAYFPLYIELEGKKCTVVGGGNVAAGKVRQLLAFGAKVVVAAPELAPELRQLAAGEQITWKRMVFTQEGADELFGDCALVVAATNEREVNVRVSEWCRIHKVPVNVVDVKELCTFYFPAVVRRGDVVVGISTGGKSPALAARIRRELAAALPEKYGTVADILGACREEIIARVPDEGERKQLFETMLTQLLGEENGGIPRHIRIGTRGSALALAQTELFIRRLQEVYPQITCEKVIIKTAGDRILDKPLQDFGGKAVFVSEFETAISDGTIDYAVHSAKDMPMELAAGLAVVCVLPREDARDVLLTRRGTQLEKLPSPVIGTGSLRRQSQLAALYPNARAKSLRGNVPTRIQKLKDGSYDGIILAAAGLRRLGLDQDEELSYEYLDEEKMLPAGGQGIIAIEGRAEGQEFLQAVTDEQAALALAVERDILKRLDAGCHEAVGVYAEVVETETTAEAETPCAGESGRLTPDTQVRIRIFREQDGVLCRADETTTISKWETIVARLTEKLCDSAPEQR